MITSHLSPLFRIAAPVLGALSLASCGSPDDTATEAGSSDPAPPATEPVAVAPPVNAELTEQWQLVGRSAESAFAIEENSITRKGNIVEATILTIADQPIAISTGELGYITSRYRYDCQQRTEQILNKVAFTVDGVKILEDLRPEPATQVPSVSTSEQVWTAACYGFRSGGQAAPSIAKMQQAYRALLKVNPIPDPIVPPS